MSEMFKTKVLLPIHNSFSYHVAIKVLTIIIGNHHWASIDYLIMRGVIKKKLDFSFINTKKKI